MRTPPVLAILATLAALALAGCTGLSGTSQDGHPPGHGQKSEFADGDGPDHGTTSGTDTGSATSPPAEATAFYRFSPQQCEQYPWEAYDEGLDQEGRLREGLRREGVEPADVAVVQTAEVVMAVCGHTRGYDYYAEVAAEHHEAMVGWGWTQVMEWPDES